jgi:hypothetical protein
LQKNSSRVQLGILIVSSIIYIGLLDFNSKIIFLIIMAKAHTRIVCKNGPNRETRKTDG